MPAEFRLVFASPVIGKNLAVALVVGTVLNLINQADSVLVAGEVDWLKLALNFCVPFLVSSYGSYNSLRAMSPAADSRRGAAAP